MSATVVKELLWRCAVERDDAGWEEFVRRFEPRLRAGVGRALRRAGVRMTPELLADMMQEVYCHLLEGGGRRLLSFRGRTEGEVAVYLTRVAHNLVLDQLRLARAAKRGQDRTVGWHAELVEAMVDPAAGPEERLLGRERRRIFLRRCRRLVRGKAARRDGRIVRLALLEGWTSREISEAVARDLKPSSVDSILHRLRRRLRQDGLLLPKRVGP